MLWVKLRVSVNNFSKLSSVCLKTTFHSLSILMTKQLPRLAKRNINGWNCQEQDFVSSKNK